MNHIYRLVWSQVRRAWLVVSELARGRGKAGRTSTSRRTRRAGWAALPLSLPMLALATAPSGVTAMDGARPAGAIVAAHPTLAPTVIASAASSTHPAGGQVTAGSGRIDYGDHLTTIQQNSQNLSLNWLSFNIGAQDTVNFLQPNAQSIAVNRIADPNGSMILGHLNANGQVFLINPNGVLFGQGAQVSAGGLVASTLDVSDSQLDRGTLHFTGTSVGRVTNLGTITAAPGGYVALLGHAVSNQGAIHAPAGSVALAGGSAVTLRFDGNHLLDMQIDASTLNALAENKQLIVADGGQVLMSAGAKDSLLASVVNNSGTIQARTVENRAGKIVLLGGMEAGTTQVDGTLDASAPNGGDGGFVETSAAHVRVADGAKITTLAATGNAGTWLIDPHDFTIAFSGGDMSGGTLSSQLGGGNVTIQSSQGANASGSGDIHVNDLVNWGANTLTLTAAHDVDINAVMTASGSAGLALNPSTANGGDAAIGGGTVNVNMVSTTPGQSGRVDFTGGSNTLKINGQSYTIITTLGAPGSTSGTDLQGISGALNCFCYFALGANIDASATANWGDSAFGSAIGSGFVPIGHRFNATDSKMFTGTFDGLGHTISGLTINRPGSNNVGLFGYTYTTTKIRNVGLLGVSIQGQSNVGGLVGYNYGTISQAYATGAINGNLGGADVGFGGGANIGGLVGYNDSSGRISQVYASGAISGATTVGGLIGYNNHGPISQAYATGTVGSSGGDVGGLIGINDSGSISQAYATGTVSGSNDVGGLVGYNISGAISQAYATGAVSGSNYVGGLVGNNVSGTTISQVYATGAVSGTGSNVGGLVGFNNAGTITNSYWDTETTGQSTSSGGTGLTTKALIAALPAGFTAARWGNVGNQTTPYLLGMSGNQVFNTNDLPTGTVTPSNRPNLYTVILDLNQLQAVNTGLAGRYVLGNDIDASASIAWLGVELNAQGRPIIAYNGFRPIGAAGAPFTGVLDGLGHTINNLTINWPNTDDVGLFGVTGNGSAIRNLGLLGGSVAGRNYVGGLVGDNGGTITNTYAAGMANGLTSDERDYVGGLVGFNEAGGTITNAYATGAVRGNNYVGGLVGSNLGAITNAYATGAVNGIFYNGGGNYVGGLVGSNEAGGTITNTYATGAVGGNNYVGGLVGLYGGGAITGSYWNRETTGRSTSDGGGTGLTTVQMMDPASFAAWSTDISAVGGSSAAWRIYAGDTAPLLRIFMTGLAVSAKNLGTVYNGTAFAGSSSLVLGTLTPSYWRPSSSVDASLILGDANARTSTPATNAGSYALASDLYSGQMGYDIAFTPGTLTIAPATLTYLADTATSTYGSTPTGLTGTVTGFVNGQTLADATTGTASFTTGATANSNVGSYAINGSGLSANYGNYTFAQATGNAAALTVNPAILTYLATSTSSIYGSTPGGLTGTVTGFVNGQTLTSATTGTASFATAATATSNVGNYAIDGSGLTANYGNYTFAQAAGNAAALTVNPALLTYLADTATTTYGNTPSGLTGTVTGFVNGQTLANATTGTASFATGATATSNVGSYAIDGNGLTANYGNYTFAQATGNAAALTVNPAILTITANNASKTYGDTLTFAGNEFTASGLQNGETIGDVALTSAGAAASAGVTGGPYTITSNAATGGSFNAGNYAITYRNGSLTVGQAALTVTANDDSKTYNGLAYMGGHGVTYNGFVNGETTSVLGGALGYAGDAQGATNAGDYTITPDGLTSGNYAITYRNGRLTVGQAALTVTANDDSKTYNGLAYTGGHGVTYSGFVNGETTSVLGGVLRYAGDAQGATNAGGYTITPDGLTAGNYAITYRNGSLMVGQAALTVTANDDSKTYNGLAYTGGHGITYSGFVNGETTSVLGGALRYAGDAQGATNAGGYTITPDGLTSGNYAIAYRNGRLSVGQAALTVSSSNVSKTYDGGLSAIGTAVVSGGTLFGSDTLSGGNFAFTDKNVGIGKHVTINGVTVSDGNSGGNYAVTYVDNSSSTITARSITVDATGTNRVYDGTTADAVKLASIGILAGDTVDFSGTGAFADKNVGVAKAVGVSGIVATGADAGNYSYNTTTNTTADISQLGITVDATGTNRVYDGSTADAVTLASAGVLSGDTVHFAGTGSFLTKNVGTARAVSVSGIAASGADAGNYSYNTTANTTADITAKTITVDAIGVDKVYDGSTAAKIAALGTTGLVAGDAVTFGNASAAFADKNAGSNKAVTVNGIIASGADAGNYSYNTTTNTTADISPLGITVDATGTNRVYDGSTADAVTLASVGVLSGDTVHFTGTGSFLTKNVGTGKTVNVFGITASGSEANNYSFKTSATTTADVTPATLTYRADTAHFKIGQMPAGLSGAVTGFVGGDTLTDATDGTLTWQTPATATSPAGPYAIDGSGLSALNYLFEQAPGNAAALQVVDGSAPRLVASTVAGLQQSSDATDAVHAPHAPDVHIVDGGVRLP
ncbi:filamentous hemagglutinin family protein [Xanthomonas sp. JAI131]|uniref:MBG domain-containing protein n=1 Tax=Xanthomonas sp. JAI131 TaxID=2723067 RepID=UPI0015C99B8F|nr:MBG domain-containing protein [Xanthomonas sp. JAI131]NYF19424.1 filamentous hemagglutinin family protein [Xanthomonas sp. JAI131]